MIKIVHRLNSIKQLDSLPKEFGVEIDIRRNSAGEIYLNHDFGTGDLLEDYLKNFHHRFIVFNIKEAGTENQCIELAKKYGISKENYFLLDVEFPYLYQASRNQGIKEIAVRYSEAEPIEFTEAQKGFVNWVWIDTNTQLPLNGNIVSRLKEFKTCLVSPDRWGRPQDIEPYQKQIKDLNLELDAVMCGEEYLNLWK